MSTGALIAVIIVCVLVAVAIAAALAARQARLRRQFGPEYDRLARQSGHRPARAELATRKRRVAGLGIRPLSAEQSTHYASEWPAVQELFVERPAQALAAAAALVRRVAADRGYRMEDRGQVMADLSVSHARRLDGYRRAEDMSSQADAASTEDLRQAMLWYRAMFRDLTGVSGGEPADEAQASRPSRVPRPRLPVPRAVLPWVPAARPHDPSPDAPPTPSQETSAK
jgi:hypothetical protein